MINCIIGSIIGTLIGLCGAVFYSNHTFKKWINKLNKLIEDSHTFKVILKSGK